MNLLVSKRFWLSLSLLLTLSLAAQAHTLSVLGNRLVQEPGKKVTVYLTFGHLLPVDELSAPEMLANFQLQTPSGSVKPLEIASTRSLHANEVVLEEPGLYQASTVRKPSIHVSYTDATGKPGFSRLPKNEFKLPAGATLTQAARGHQFSKALILCGALPSKLPAPLGHELEIIVESTPAAEGFSPDEPVKARVLFQGKPLKGVKVMAASTTLSPDGLPETASETDSEGRVSLELPESGIWILNVLHKFDSAPQDRAAFDVESYVATFAIPVAPVK